MDIEELRPVSEMDTEVPDLVSKRVATKENIEKDTEFLTMNYMN